MGNWNINIQGVGCHHNEKNPTDANLMAQAFVNLLKQAGHYIEGATFTFGSKENLNGPTDNLDPYKSNTSPGMKQIINDILGEDAIIDGNKEVENLMNIGQVILDRSVASIDYPKG